MFSIADPRSAAKRPAPPVTGKTRGVSDNSRYAPYQSLDLNLCPHQGHLASLLLSNAPFLPRCFGPPTQASSAREWSLRCLIDGHYPSPRGSVPGVTPQGDRVLLSVAESSTINLGHNARPVIPLGVPASWRLARTSSLLKNSLACHSEERSDEESLISLAFFKERFIAALESRVRSSFSTRS